MLAAHMLGFSVPLWPAHNSLLNCLHSFIHILQNGLEFHSQWQWSQVIVVGMAVNQASLSSPVPSEFETEIWREKFWKLWARHHPSSKQPRKAEEAVWERREGWIQNERDGLWSSSPDPLLFQSPPCLQRTSPISAYGGSGRLLWPKSETLRE